VRGITLNYKNSLTFNFDTIKDMVINNRDDVKIVKGNLVGIVLRSTGDKLYYSVVWHFIGEIS
jgi:hypothetical protein